MAETYIYDQDCDDFATLGLCGRLDEMVCTFEEEANGMSELTLEHPIDPEPLPGFSPFTVSGSISRAGLSATAIRPSSSHS